MIPVPLDSADALAVRRPANAGMDSAEALRKTLGMDGFVFLHGQQTRALLARTGALDDFDTLASSWDHLLVDTYMADQGRYRRRRHAVFQAGSSGSIRRMPDRPHFQAKAYNPLNGGIERWFAPMAPEVLNTRTFGTVLEFARTIFLSSRGPDAVADIEVHQFRIEAAAGVPGSPTPEGMHRDGVDDVLVLMIRRENVASGTTTIRRLDANWEATFTLAEPFDAALLDDRRVVHGVTPVTPINPEAPAYRDVLIVTFKAIPSSLSDR